MTYTPEQVEEVKKQILDQTRDFPEDQKKQIEEQIGRMSPDELEGFVKQQMGASGQKMGGEQKGIFRMIVEGDVPSKKVDEDKDVIAVVSKRAASKGHVIIIPKSAVTEEKKIPKAAFLLARKLGTRMKKKLKAKDILIEPFEGFGEFILNVVPVYDEKVDFSKQYEVSDEEMAEVEKKLWEPKKKKVVKVKKTTKPATSVKLNRRIP